MNHWPQSTHQEPLRTLHGKGKRGGLTQCHLSVRVLANLLPNLGVSSHSINAQNARMVFQLLARSVFRLEAEGKLRNFGQESSSS